MIKRCHDTWSATLQIHVLLLCCIWGAARNSLFEHVAEPDKLILVHFHFLLHFEKFGVLNVFLWLCQFFLFFHDLCLELFNLLLERHNKEGLLLVALCRLNYRCQCPAICLLCILDELILLEELLDGTFFATHLIFKNLNLGLQFHVLFLESVCTLFQLQHLFLELFWKLLWIVDPSDCLIFIFSMNGSAVACDALMLRLFRCATDTANTIPDRHSLHRVGHLGEVVLLDLIRIKVIYCRLRLVARLLMCTALARVTTSTRSLVICLCA